MIFLAVNGTRHWLSISNLQEKQSERMSVPWLYSENLESLLRNINLESYFIEDTVYRDLLKIKSSANFCI